MEYLFWVGLLAIVALGSVALQGKLYARSFDMSGVISNLSKCCLNKYGHTMVMTIEDLSNKTTKITTSPA